MTLATIFANLHLFQFNDAVFRELLSLWQILRSVFGSKRSTMLPKQNTVNQKMKR